MEPAPYLPLIVILMGGLITLDVLIVFMCKHLRKKLPPIDTTPVWRRADVVNRLAALHVIDQDLDMIYYPKDNDNGNC